MLDGEKAATDSGHKLETVLQELGGDLSLKRSAQTQSEILAMWMAIGVFCPEDLRKQLATDRAKGHITDYGIALQLRMPQRHVPALFGPQYLKTMDSLLK